MKMHKEAAVIVIPCEEWQQLRKMMLSLMKGWRNVKHNLIKTYIGYFRDKLSDKYGDRYEDRHMLLEDFDIFHEACESLYKIQESDGKNVQTIWEDLDTKLQELRNNYIDND